MSDKPRIDYDKSRPDSPWKIVQALVVLALIICGFIGIAVHVFNSEIGVVDVIAWLTETPLHSVLVLLSLGVVLFLHRYITHQQYQQNRTASNYLVYGMMFLGAFFVFRLMTTGHW